jgi:hypothetical protein
MYVEKELSESQKNNSKAPFYAMESPEQSRMVAEVSTVVGKAIDLAKYPG